jgi:hypothetical protein
MRRYSPYNGKRRAPDIERFVLQRGSVLTFGGDEPVEIDALARSLEAGVGRFRSEGLGDVDVEPWYLASLHPAFAEPEPRAQPSPGSFGAPALPLLQWAERRGAELRVADEAFVEANAAAEWLVSAIEGLDAGTRRPTRSQWNRLCSIVRAHLDRSGSIPELERVLDAALFEAGGGVGANAWRCETRQGPLSKVAIQRGLGPGHWPAHQRLLTLLHTARLVARGLSHYRREPQEAG